MTTAIGAQNLGQCQGIHITMPVVGPDPDTMNDLTEFETGVSSGLPVLPRPRLRLLQAAKHSPSNVGLRSCRLAHGQAAWILEKFYQWMDCNGLPENVVSMDELWIT